MTPSPDFGAFVISLDFELYWGVRDFLDSNEGYWENLRGEREAIKTILTLFEEYDIAATWAAVGFLFADSPADVERLQPRVLPKYHDSKLSPYGDLTADSPENASLYYAPDLIDLIKDTGRQEVGTHTFSHYYCLEEGQTAEMFEADLESAIKAAREKSLTIRSIVFPRNQHNPAYDAILRKHGVSCIRGNQKSRMYQFDRQTQSSLFYRANRLLDSYINLSGINTIKWNDVWLSGIADVPASIFLRPVGASSRFRETLQFRRITRSLEYAAKHNEIFHLWWHPHNFGLNRDENIRFLRKIFEKFLSLKREHDIRSLSMVEVADHAAALRAVL